MNDSNLTVSNSYDIKSFNNFWLFFVIGTGSGLILFLIPFCGIFLALPLLIAGAVFCYILLYRFWDLIQDSNPQITPGKAIGFCFIPFYNLYWLYVSNVQLCNFVNQYCKERNINIIPVNTSFALIWYISVLASIPLTILIILITFGAGVLFVPIIYLASETFHALFFKQLIDASIKIIESKTIAK